jgi:glycosyltransferase involved in cell wall biosynthesis
MIKGRDIIVTSLQSWDIGIGSNCKNIATEFARNNRVLYVNYPLDRATVLRKRKDPKVRKRLDILKGKADDLIRISDNIWTLYPKTILESINWIPWNWVFDKVNIINNRRVARQIQSAIRRLDIKNPILFNDCNIFRGFYLKELLKPQLYVYLLRDNIITMDFWKRHGKRTESSLIRKSDLVLTNSDYLADRARQYNPACVNIGQGFDLSLYDKNKVASVPPDIAYIHYPVIGYTGALVIQRLDIDLIRFLAQQYPQWSIVLVGPEDETFKKSDLHALKNVHFLGNKSPEQLPQYVDRFDVAINPQIINEMTIGNYPLKIDEYLAMGKPVVATKTEAMSLFARHTYLAVNKVEFGEKIEKALNENSPEQETFRELFARDHSMENNIKKIYRAMEKIMGDQPESHGLPEQTNEQSINLPNHSPLKAKYHA